MEVHWYNTGMTIYKVHVHCMEYMQLYTIYVQRTCYIHCNIHTCDTLHSWYVNDMYIAAPLWWIHSAYGHALANVCEHSYGHVFIYFGVDGNVFREVPKYIYHSTCRPHCNSVLCSYAFVFVLFHWDSILSLLWFVFIVTSWSAWCSFVLCACHSLSYCPLVRPCSLA